MNLLQHILPGARRDAAIDDGGCAGGWPGRVADKSANKSTETGAETGAQSRALFDTAASREIEAAALARHGEHVLMQRAGEAVVRLALAIAPHAQRVWVAAGPGNNGGDGLVAAALLQGLGKDVEVTWLGDPTRLSGDAAWALSLARQAGVAFIGAAPALSPALAIDALLGLGGSRAPAGALRDAIVQLNTLPCPVLAVDLPSGLDADTGRLQGDIAVRATATISLLTLKPGLFTGQGRDHVGELWFADLGVAVTAASGHAYALECSTVATDGNATTTPAGAASAGTPVVSASPTARLGDGKVAHAIFSTRRHAAHKGSFGDLWVIGGARGMTGAAMLASRAGLLAGAGRVLLNLLATDDRSEHDATDPLRPELMHRDRAAWQAAQVLEAATVVCGCGGGDAVAALLPSLLSRAARLVLDADALNAIATDPALAEVLRQRGRRGHPSVLTPHPLEAARLLGCSTGEVQSDRLTAARALSKRFGAVVVLKGSGSIVSTPSSPPVVNPTGNARLATAGSGDVLAGWLGGVWSRHAGQAVAAPSREGGDDRLCAAREAAEAAVWLHGRAAELDAPATLAGLAMPASDLIGALPAAVLSLWR